MFVKKIQMSFMVIILTAALEVSKASMDLPELDSIGRMPEITVTAPRYEYQDEAWAGLVEEVIVEARRLSSSEEIFAETESESNLSFVSSIPSEDICAKSMQFVGSTYLFLSLVLNLALIPLPLIYMSLSVFLGSKEAKK